MTPEGLVTIYDLVTEWFVLCVGSVACLVFFVRFISERFND